MTEEGPDFLSQDEVNRLLYYAVKYAGPKGLPREDIDVIYKWAIGARLEQAMLYQALRGEIALSVDDGEVRISLPPKAAEVGAKV